MPPPLSFPQLIRDLKSNLRSRISPFQRIAGIAGETWIKEGFRSFYRFITAVRTPGQVIIFIVLRARKASRREQWSVRAGGIPRIGIPSELGR